MGEITARSEFDDYPQIKVDYSGVVVAALKQSDNPDAPVVYVDDLLNTIRLIIREEIERAK